LAQHLAQHIPDHQDIMGPTGPGYNILLLTIYGVARNYILLRLRPLGLFSAHSLVHLGLHVLAVHTVLAHGGHLCVKIQLPLYCLVCRAPRSQHGGCFSAGFLFAQCNGVLLSGCYDVGL
jgi:hypothetical protein